jgi:hypothetical protein
VRKRRNDNGRLAVLITQAAATLGSLLWARAARRPVDSFAILAAVAVSIIIIVNAVFLQSGAHPAPFFANPLPPPAAPESRPRVAEPSAPPRSADATHAPQNVVLRRNDPIAELIGPSPRIMAVQRVLSDYGYGQIKPSGMLDQPTSAAIERYEREHKLPITGRVSDRLVSGLAAMIGHPLE